MARGGRTDADAEEDALYALPPAAFTAARNALATKLRAAGRVDDAKRVKLLARPSVPAWVANQLARAHRERVEALLEAGQALRDAHRTLLRGGGRSDYDDAVRRQRGLLREATAAAGAVLRAGRASAGAGVLDRVTETLQAAAAEEGLGEALLEGRLTRPLALPGLGANGAPAAPSRPAPHPRGRPTPAPHGGRRARARAQPDVQRRRDAEERKAARRADARRRTEERKAAAAQRRLDRAEEQAKRRHARAVEAATKRVEALRKRMDVLRTEATRAEEELARLR